MRKILLIVALLTLFISCNENGSGIEREAKENMKTLFKEIAKYPESVKFENIEVMFSNDSLCIIHADITAQNGRGDDITEKNEHIYLLSNGRAYESICPIDQFKTFVSEEEYNKNKEKEFYKDLDYPQGLYHLSSMTINSIGRNVNTEEKDETIKLPSMTGTGDWNLGIGVDEFGDEIGTNFLYLIGRGTFSNSATTNSSLRVKLEVFNEDQYFLDFYEYDDHLVKDEKFFTLKIKDSKGNIRELRMFNCDNGMTLFVPEAFEEFKQMMLEGGEISCVAEMGTYIKSKYNFKMDLTGFKKALTFIQ